MREKEKEGTKERKGAFSCMGVKAMKLCNIAYTQAPLIEAQFSKKKYFLAPSNLGPSTIFLVGYNNLMVHTTILIHVLHIWIRKLEKITASLKSRIIIRKIVKERIKIR